eukprot:8372004-Pyramimonas_sp.AAC.1
MRAVPVQHVALALARCTFAVQLCKNFTDSHHELLRTAFWHDSGSSRRNDQADPRPWNPENNDLACFRLFKQVSSNAAIASMEMNLCRGL